MSLYKLDKNKLVSVLSQKIDLEKDIQLLTEENLEVLFGIKFVSGKSTKEFSIGVAEQDFYIDTLAYDENQKSIVIIEYKKDRSISVIDQGFAYLSAVLNHKADMVLELNDKLKKSFNKDSIDWEATRVIFISPEFTNYQRNAINFKDLPIYLYEVKLYENGLVEYDPIKPYRTTESISSLSKDKTIQKVSKEVKVYSEENFLPESGEIRDLYNLLKEKLLYIDSTLIFHPTKYYIGVQKPGNWRVIVALNIKSNKIAIDYNRSRPEDLKSDTEKRLVYRENSFKSYGQNISTLTVEDYTDVDYACKLFEELLEKFIQQFK